MADFFQPVGNPPTSSGICVPPIIYGTGGSRNQALVFSALASNIRALDTACQPKNYDEAMVGRALQAAFLPESKGGLGLSRNDVFLQSKFTTPRGHTSTTSPYSPLDSIPAMVQKSIQMTLGKLQVNHVDALLLHAPMPTNSQTVEVWQAMEALVGNETRILGVCNVSLAQLQNVWSTATVKPSIVQNGFRAQTKYDQDIRSFCFEKGIIYQAFGVVRENRQLLASSFVGWLAQKMGVSREDCLFLATLSLGSIHNSPGFSVLTGTSKSENLARLVDCTDKFGVLPPILREAFESTLREH